MTDIASIIVLIIMVISTPCENEHSMNCHWLASQYGNGIGRSFISIEQPDGLDLVIWANGTWRKFP